MRGSRRGRRRRSVQETETVPENQPDQMVENLRDGTEESPIEDASQEGVDDREDCSEKPVQEEPQNVKEQIVAPVKEEQLGLGEAKNDVREEKDAEDGDDRSTREEEAFSSVQLEGVSGAIDKAELEKLFDPRWAALIKKLPQFCDPGLVLEENDHREGNTKLMYQVPMMPIAECVKERWEDVNAELRESSQISPFRKLDDKRYWISETDFKRYCQSSTVDREYCIQVEKEVMRGESSSYGGPPRRRPFVKKSSAIRNPLLQACENGFKKCDESARMALRATSHGAFMTNALRNMLERSPSEQQAEVMSLLDGIQGCIESVADASARVVARATVSRRNICMSQIQRHEMESFEDFITLPMDSKNLFHGEFYPTMQEHKRVNASLRRKGPQQAVDLDQTTKRPSLMDAAFTHKRPRFDFHDSHRGRFAPPPNQYQSWGGPSNEGYRPYHSGRGGGSHLHRGNKRW